MDRKTDLIREKFDAWAPNWDQGEAPDPKVLDFLFSVLPTGKRVKVLDLACGTGVISGRLLERYGGEIFGLDLSPKMIEMAKKKYEGEPRIHFSAGDFYADQTSDYDLIVMHNAYPHFLDVDALCKRLKEALKEGGYFAVIHSCGRQELNAHHAAHASPISFLLSSPEEEAKRFSPAFQTVDFGENEAYYYFILKRN